jgi:hypothetical protein
MESPLRRAEAEAAAVAGTGPGGDPWVRGGGGGREGVGGEEDKAETRGWRRWKATGEDAMTAAAMDGSEVDDGVNTFDGRRRGAPERRGGGPWQGWQTRRRRRCATGQQMGTGAGFKLVGGHGMQTCDRCLMKCR